MTSSSAPRGGRRLGVAAAALAVTVAAPLLSWSEADAAKRVTRIVAASTACPSVTVPAYFYAGPTWDTAVSGPSSVPRTLILNPSSGPGGQQDPNYVTTVQKARAAGARVIGYVHTSYGTRPADVVLEEVARYQAWYGVVDVFFDEVSATTADLEYYRALSDRVRAAGGLVVLNPGVHPDERYMAVGDQVVTFEGSYDSYRRAQVPAWTAAYPASRFTHLVYSTTKRQMGNALSLAEQRRAGNVYVTNDVLDNPWDTLPSYWGSELTSLASRC